MVLSNTSRGDIGWKKFLIAGWAFAECLLFGGLLYGWGSLVFVFKQRGIYADLCPNQPVLQNGSSSYSNESSVSVVTLSTPAVSGNTSDIQSELDPAAIDKTKSKNCGPQDSMFTLCFTIGSALFCASCFLMGHIHYKFGTRVTRMMSFVLFTAGSLILAFVNKELPWLIFPGLSLLGWGGLPLLVTNMQVSNLFIKGSSSVVGLLCGGYDMSSAIMLLIKLSDAAGFSYKYMFLLITALHCLTLISTFAFLPKGYISKPAPQDMETEIADGGPAAVELLQKEKQIASGEVILDDKEVEKLQLSAPNKSQPELPSLRSCIQQPMFVTHVIWLIMLQLRFYYFIGTINPYLDRTFNGDDAMVSYFTNVCFYTMMGGLFSSFLTGIVYDWQKRIFQNSRSQMQRDVMPAVFPLAMGSILALLLSILVLIPVPNLLYLTFIVMTLCRSFLYSMAAAFLSALFPSEYFGMLYGIIIILGGVFGGLQFAFFKWAEAYVGGSLHADIFLLCLVLISFIHPGFIWYKSSQAERSHSLSNSK